ncbi:metallophosphoesterase [Prolixibacteraceae bacterium Z1-6]|uniref:Metallophosphoesterase n=1 Tax=Draconibacterium aestuarii TaxID=2998507 RepID=A0A9X3F579_9BACT|nr:metallophosphoesterase [Prolixibacteraceae bacterium Z1-6]
MKKHKLRVKLIALITLFIFGTGMSHTLKAQIKIGVFADCQYCDCEPAGNRYYRNSLLKLSDCLMEFNKDKQLDLIVGLGDLIDRDYESYKQVNAVLAKSNTKICQVTGNHDFAVDSAQKEDVPKALQLKKTYYSVKNKGWQFIFLDGNRISVSSNNKETVNIANKMLAELTAHKQPNNKEWNGGLGQDQIKWLEEQLINAEQKGQKVAIFCHYPLLPLEAHTLWDAAEVIEILKKYNSVKAWINGHNHAGNYALQDQIHFITMRGMVDTESENAFSKISFSDETIQIEAYGREISRTLPIK